MKKLLLVIVLTASFFILANTAGIIIQPHTEALSSASDKSNQTFDQLETLPAYLYSFSVPDKSTYGTGRFWGILGISASIVSTLVYVGYKKYRAENDKSVNNDHNS